MGSGEITGMEQVARLSLGRHIIWEYFRIFLKPLCVHLLNTACSIYSCNTGVWITMIGGTIGLLVVPQFIQPLKMINETEFTFNSTYGQC